MKILFYLHHYPNFGGIEKVTEILSQYLAKKGHQIALLSYIQNQKAFHSDNKISYYRMPESTSEPTNKNEEYIRTLLEEQQFDIIIFQDSYAPIEDVLFNATYGLNCKIITVEHNTPDCGWIYFWYRLYHVRKSLKDLLLYPYHYWYMSSHTKKRHQKLYTKSDKYVLLSKNFIPILIKRFKIKSLEKCCCINNPLTISIPEEKNYPPKRNELLFVGRFSKQKGINMLLDMWRQLSPNYPDWVLKLVGGGELELSIIQYIEKNKLKNVQLEGFNTDTSMYYQNASILCLTSVFEGWGLVLTEAMSRGCIPVAFQSFKSVTDIIDDKENGFLIPPFMQESFIEKLKYLMDNAKERETMAAKAIQKSKYFTIDNIGKEWEKLLSVVTQ